jgi:hypothetical protein
MNEISRVEKISLLIFCVEKIIITETTTKITD